MATLQMEWWQTAKQNQRNQSRCLQGLFLNARQINSKVILDKNHYDFNVSLCDIGVNTLPYLRILSKNGPRREKTCLRGLANNKGADQPAHPRSMISPFVIFFSGV